MQGNYRGSFSFTEASVQNAFEMLSYVFTIIWSHPNQFGYAVLAVAVTVCMSVFLFARYPRRRRHRMHIALWIKRKKPDGIDENAQSLYSFNFSQKILNLLPAILGFTAV